MENSRLDTTRANEFNSVEQTWAARAPYRAARIVYSLPEHARVQTLAAVGAEIAGEGVLAGQPPRWTPKTGN